MLTTNPTRKIIAKPTCPTFQTVTKGYRGSKLDSFVRKKFKKAVMEIGENHTSPKRGFVPAKKRWLVERGFAWLGDCYRLKVDNERSVKTSMAMIRLAFIRLMLRRLVPG